MILGLLAVAAATSTAALAVNSGAGGDAASQPNRAQIEQIVHDYILAHPEILPQAMERLKDKRIAEAIEKHRQDIETPYAGAWEGAQDGDVAVVEFFDYNCGYCRASLPDITRLIADDRRVKLVYRELPILSEESNLAARVSLLAAEQGKYGAFHKALYAGGRVTKESILGAAAKAGIEHRAAENAMNSNRYDPEIENNMKLAQELGASGTPTFVVGNRILSGAVGYEVLKEAVSNARATKK
ncbi:MAG: DsbA family protein [Sphingobium sp.]|nr:DsbA family protein [Sphingobium sp.]MBP6110907.1 DsbA family protein [Sphingobium sp.]MBP8670605.1 DsbA family protein [Sphingobium sp.]MBP9157021.1 DsbA family protein [Sphingobium sp.]MCC6481665.1 DsbA family protein [Sphingomonadaceae bacterium]